MKTAEGIIMVDDEGDTNSDEYLKAYQ